MNRSRELEHVGMFETRLCSSMCVCLRQVAGRLHVEVWRGTEGSEGEGSGQFDIQLKHTDRDPQERKVDCVVRT